MLQAPRPKACSGPAPSSRNAPPAGVTSSRGLDSTKRAGAAPQAASAAPGDEALAAVGPRQPEASAVAAAAARSVARGSRRAGRGEAGVAALGGMRRTFGPPRCGVLKER